MAERVPAMNFGPDDRASSDSPDPVGIPSPSPTVTSAELLSQVKMNVEYQMGMACGLMLSKDEEWVNDLKRVLHESQKEAAEKDHSSINHAILSLAVLGFAICCVRIHEHHSGQRPD